LKNRFSIPLYVVAWKNGRVQRYLTFTQQTLIEKFLADFAFAFSIKP
jgi:hypothetical protein